ncbi:VOC family protein [Aeromicrobium wangtongii]|uniref:VOC family protein n=1 Tax=Aeromicrobium wangtongii TaxID=2969247 RepID=UPI002017F537|nr:VOC family protein [Aeromicrobium wangtongii]MCL3819914.1 VOC family protein [Aeromicrobium wangtongii]
MPIVTFKDLIIDANDVSAMEGFWSRALHLDSEFFEEDGSAVLRGTRQSQTVWINLVPEAKTVKDRVHLDLCAESLDDFAGVPQVTEDGEFPWTTFTDPEGNEFCVFVGDRRSPGLKDVVVDSVDHRAIGAWWAEVWGGTLGEDDEYTYLDDIPGAPVESFDFVPVPEPKTVKNRIHWDVVLEPGASVDDLVAKGATVLAEPTEDEQWTVMADPEGNEFCVFEHR